jgi:aryl carrier-like protein
MAETNDTSKALPGKPEQLLGQQIEAQRGKVLQAHAVMTCVREVLLYTVGEDAVIYAEAANAAAVLANDAAEGLDSVRLKPMLEALRHQPSSVDS